MRVRRHTGFTLYEFMIAAVVAILLATAAVTLAGKSTADARAAVILSTLRAVRDAAVRHYADTRTWSPGFALNRHLEQDAGSFLNKYLNRVLLASSDTADPPPQYLVWMKPSDPPVFYAFANVDDRFESYATRQALERLGAHGGYCGGQGEGAPFKALKSPPEDTGYGRIGIVIARDPDLDDN
jgi:type II secretory pathway pseudopilin PulG